MFGLKRLKTSNKLSKIKGPPLKFKKTTSGSYSRLDVSIQAQKSHATVPLSLYPLGVIFSSELIEEIKQLAASRMLLEC
jgi:hypothetical protein